MGGIRPCASAALMAVALLFGLGAGGCIVDEAPAGSGTTDGGGDDAGSGGSDAGGGGSDTGHMCPGLGCAPACPNGVLKDAYGCDTCQCAPASDAGGTGDAGGAGVCATSGDCAIGELCGFLESAGCAATGQCFHAGAYCALASIVACGCNGAAVNGGPSCTAGLPGGYLSNPVLHQGPCSADAGGDAGGACVSQKGGRCGGNTAQPCTCATGLVCTPGDGGLPIGDVGGTCQ